MRDAVVIGGAGTVGSWFSELLRADGWRVTTVDTCGADVLADVTAGRSWASATCRDAELVAFALPEDLVPVSVEAVAAVVGPDTVLVPMSSVQAPLFAKHVGLECGRRIVGCNPMFRPTLAADGRVVLVVAREDAVDSAVEAVSSTIAAGGAVVEHLDPSQHDALVAMTQVVPHAALLAVAASVAASGIDLALLWRVAPPPARVVLAASARILESTPHVYVDIQRAPGADIARASLAEELGRLAAMSAPQMTEHLIGLRGPLAQLLPEAGALAAQLYEQTGPREQESA